MKSLTAILAAADRLLAAKEEAVLVTLVKTRGSTYRKPGARMLILPGCRTIGTISGGCLEPAVARQAWEQTRNGKPVVLEIATTPEDDDWPPSSPSTGCHGKLFLLAEPFHSRHPTLDFIAQCHRTHHPALIVHHFLVSPDGSLLPDKSIPIDSGATGLATTSVAGPVPPLFSSREKREHDSFLPTKSQWLDHAQSPAFFEILPPPQHLLICGAGDDARPLANIAHELAWQITILDSRARLATRERFPTATTLSATGPAALPTLLKPNTAVVLMSHRFADDRDYLTQLLTQTQGAPHGNAGPYPPLYIGLLGPRPRTDRLLADLAQQNIHPTPQQLATLHSPAGLSLGPTHSPESIALSIVAQIQSIVAQASCPCPSSAAIDSSI